MTEPTTVNVGLIVPNTGDLPGTWGSNALNPDFVALDGYLGGVQTISASNAPIVLTSPAGFTPTAGGGPTQAQNAVLRFTGSMSANVQVTLPLPGPIVIENLTTGAFVLSFRAIDSGQVIAVDQGEIQTVYNDGTNVRFVNLGHRIGETFVWAGLNSMPAWVGACTVPPYLPCDGSVYNFTTYPYLGARLGGAFGGNGITTFGVPDLRGRMALPYDGTGTRITTGGCGLNGQTIGASLDEQVYQLTSAQMPSSIPATGAVTLSPSNQLASTGSNGVSAPGTQQALVATGGNLSASVSISVGGSGNPHPNVQPSQVTGIAVIRAA